MTNNDSILDRVLETQIKQDQAQFNPKYLINSLLQTLPKRDSDIVVMRHGLNDDNLKKTLEDIGKNHNITRERVRQIESISVKQMREEIKKRKEYDNIINIIGAIIREQGGIIEENRLIEKINEILFEKLSPGMIIFFLNLIKDKFLLIKENKQVKTSWQLPDFNNEILKQVLLTTKEILIKQNKILSFDDLWNLLQESDIYKKYNSQIDKNAFLSFISISKNIQVNPFGDWGISNWTLIKPKRMNDKIYLVLKNYGKPLHFRKIAEKINQVKFDGKKAHPATIHNELIMNNDRYVLIGRGIYALKEWGYKPGVVADVIVEILQKADGPVNKKDIITKVLERRMVKETTIILALTNRKKFKKLPGGNYKLADD